MKKLRVSADFSLPIDVAGETIAILAKRGAGKTNTATVLVEELVRAGVQTVIVDPVSAWWGIRSSATGEKGAGLAVPILGGQHGDVPLEETAGKLIADVAVDSGESVLIDLSDLPTKAAMERFVWDFAERLYRRKARSGTLLHLVLEEADMFAPQSPRGGWRGDGGKMTAAIEAIVRRGRSRGLGVTLITQRSAVLNKDVLTQADVLIAMRTTGPQDVDAIRKWVAERGDEHGQTVIESLPGLKTGEGWIWNPERELLERVMFRKRRTYDSSETPKAGQKRAAPGEVAAIDLTALGEQIQETAEKAKAEDPKELKRQIAALKKELREQPAETTAEPVVEYVEVPVLDAKAIEQLEQTIGVMRELAKPMRIPATALEEGAEKIAQAIMHARHSRPAPKQVPAAASRSHPRESGGGDRKDSRPPPPKAPEPHVDGDFAPSSPQQRILNALAALEAIGVPDANKTQLALFSEASPKSSSYTNNLGALRTAGLIAYPGPSLVRLTETGRALADAGGAPSTTEELHSFVFGLVGPAKAKLLEKLILYYDAPLEKAQLAELVGASATSSSYTNNLGSLRSLGLIDYPGPGLVVALPVLFLGDA